MRASLGKSSPSGKQVSSSSPMGWLDTLPASAACLRDYQRKQIADIATALRHGKSRVLAQAPTGSGKTHIIATLVAAALASQLRVLILATRTRLVRQLHDRLVEFGVRHGVIAASLPEFRDYSAWAQVASVDTLYRRAIVSRGQPLPPADIVCFDEAHLATAATRIKLLDSYPSAIRIGLTATPARKSGLSLGRAFDSLVLGPSIVQLTRAGMLVPIRVFNTPVVTELALQDLPMDADRDYQAGALGELMSRPKLIGDVVDNWLRIANGKRSIVFAANKAHGQSLVEQFLKQGVPAELIADQDDELSREEKLGRLEAGTTLVVINVYLMAYGIDVPSVECIVLARPTRSLTQYLQMVGRGLRAFPGKTACLLIDHGHVVENLGLPTNDHAWTLSEDGNVNIDALKAEHRKHVAEKLRTCGECSALWLTSECGACCPECGWVPVQSARMLVCTQADLTELADEPPTVSPTESKVQWFYREACGWKARRKPEQWLEREKSVRWWAWCETRAKFAMADTVSKPGLFWQAVPAHPSPEAAGWLQHRVIKFAKAKAKATAA